MITILATDDISFISKVVQVSYCTILVGSKFPSPLTKSKDLQFRSQQQTK